MCLSVYKMSLTGAYAALLLKEVSFWSWVQSKRYQAKKKSTKLKKIFSFKPDLIFDIFYNKNKYTIFV